MREQGSDAPSATHHPRKVSNRAPRRAILRQPDLATCVPSSEDRHRLAFGLPVDSAVTAALARRDSGSSPRLFVNRSEQPRARRATDIIMLLSAGAGLLLLGPAAKHEPGIEQTFMTFVAGLPRGLDGLWVLLILLLAALAVVLVLAMIVRRRWAVLRDVFLAVVVAFALSLVIGRVALGSGPAVWDSLRLAGHAEYFPPLALALAASVLVTASPHVVTPTRTLGRWLLTMSAIGTILDQHTTPLGALAAVLIAAASAAVVHLVFGSSLGRPGLDDVADVLARLGIAAHSLRIAERQTVGVFLVEATDDSGRPLIIKVYGRDAHDTQLVTTIWRNVWYREAGSPTSFGRLQQAEHEAFLTLLADQTGIATYGVITATATLEYDVVLVERQRGQRLSDVPDRWNDAVVAGAWQALAELHRIGVAHGQLDDQHLIVDGYEVGLIDFHGGVVAPAPERLRTDRAQLLVTSVLAVGAERATALATTALGADELGAVLPFVQLTALTTWLRRTVHAADLDLDTVRSGAATSAGVSVPDLQKMRRVSLRSAATTALLVLAFLGIASAVGGLNFSELGTSLGNATWWLVVVGALLAQAPRVSSAVSVMGASPVPLPLGLVYALQLATSYISLAVPTSAARIAANIRFFQRRGLRAGAALAVGVLDSCAEYLVQAMLLLGILALTPISLNLKFDGAVPSGLWTALIVIAAAAAVSVVVLALVAKWRSPIVAWTKQGVTEAKGALRGLRSPRRLMMLFGGNIATDVLFALALQTFARSLGFHVGLAEVIVINVSVSLLSGLLPIPGGIGVVEGGLTLGLVKAGMGEEAAFAAVLLYRVATFYLPPIWGFFALRWLERNKHL